MTGDMRYESWRPRLSDCMQNPGLGPYSKMRTAAQRQKVLDERDAAQILYFQCYNAGAATMYHGSSFGAKPTAGASM